MRSVVDKLFPLSLDHPLVIWGSNSQVDCGQLWMHDAADHAAPRVCAQHRSDTQMLMQLCGVNCVNCATIIQLAALHYSCNGHGG